jgi:leader peptidase (prepilin peptidase)/N-methyltransferase
LCDERPRRIAYRFNSYTSFVGVDVGFELGGFLFGLLFGSFLNVCISRLPEHESVVKPRSRCTACGHPIRWYDNVPILSWIVLRTKCRDCGKRISWRYPAVELAVGVWFAVAGRMLWQAWFTPGYIATVRSADFGIPLTAIALGFAILGFLLIGLIVMDWQTQRLPDAFTLTGIAIGFGLTCVRAFFLAPGEVDIALNTTHQLRLNSPGSFQSRGDVFLTGPEAMVMGRVAAIIGAALLVLAIRWTYKAARGHQGMGLGDVKLLAMLAAFLGFGGSLIAFAVGVLSAAVYAVGLLATRRASAKTKLPFGSFLAAGGLFAALWGDQAIAWYLGFYR